MAIELVAGIAAKAAGTEIGKKAAEVAKVAKDVAKKTKEVAKKVEKPIKVVKEVDRSIKVGEKVTADKDENWGTGIVKNNASQALGAGAKGVFDKLKDYLKEKDASSASANNTETKGENTEAKETKQSSETPEDKGSLKDRLKNYLDSVDSQSESQGFPQAGDTTIENQNGDLKQGAEETGSNTESNKDTENQDVDSDQETKETGNNTEPNKDTEKQNRNLKQDTEKVGDNKESDEDSENHKKDVAKSNHETTNEVSAQEFNEDGTRELTEAEKQYYKDKLGWSDEKIKKCTIGKDGVIHYKTDRCDMEGKYSENGVLYVRKRIVLNGVTIEGVFPKFDSVFETLLSPDNMKTSAYAKECNAALKEAIEHDPELRSKFTPEQIKDIEEGRTPRGYVWHHNEEPGKMQLVKREDHDRVIGGAAHTGGNSLWGADSVDKSKKGESF